MKKQKIVITGGLGYIGMELCKLYSGEARIKDIVVIDTSFFSERVFKLRSWGIKFVQADILNEDIMAQLLSDADVVYHLAGITDVAYTKHEASDVMDTKIKSVGITGTKNILKHIPSHCKIIFPSTHVLFEGVTNADKFLHEKSDICPILSYATTKAKNEVDIIVSGRPYVILRLASVYGYSEDSMRINILPNLFCKTSAQNQKLKLFGGGKQVKPLVSVHDVVRCFKFVCDESIRNEIFHVCSQSMTVLELAKVVRSVHPSTTFIETDDEVPNLGYSLSSAKLQSFGFNFLYDIEHGVKEMIAKWSEHSTNPSVEYVQTGTDVYSDDRGFISNFELSEPINLIGYIESKAGTVRANHYHPVQEQKCLLISGKYISVVRDLMDPDAKLCTRIINAGDLSVIKPNVIHAMVFLEDSVFLNLVNGERAHANYGVTHTIPYEIVSPEFAKMLLDRYVTACRVCKGQRLAPVISMGESPLANDLLDSIDDVCRKFPLELMRCEDCNNCQLSYSVPAEEMFTEYLYVSSTSSSFRKHFSDAANKYIHEFHLHKNSLVVDIGSNDGIGLRPFKDMGIRVLGVDPATNIARLANESGITTVNDFFTAEVSSEIKSKYGSADLILASNVFAHSADLELIARSALNLLSDDGTFVIEVQYILDTFNDLTFDNIYHEHFNYWSVYTLCKMMDSIGASVYKVEHINTHGGSIRAYVKPGPVEIDSSVFDMIKLEIEFGLTTDRAYLDFCNKVHNIQNTTTQFIQDLVSKNLKIVGYGAPAKATTLLNFFGITSDQISYVVEDNKLKHYKFIPGTGIQIFPTDRLAQDRPDVVLVFAWNYFDEIVKNNIDLASFGTKFINIRDII